MNAILLEIAAWLAVARGPIRVPAAIVRNPARIPAPRPQPVARAVFRQQPYSRRLISKRGHF